MEHGNNMGRNTKLQENFRRQTFKCRILHFCMSVGRRYSFPVLLSSVSLLPVLLYAQRFFCSFLLVDWRRCTIFRSQQTEDYIVPTRSKTKIEPTKKRKKNRFQPVGIYKYCKKKKVYYDYFYYFYVSNHSTTSTLLLIRVVENEIFPRFRIIC